MSIHPLDAAGAVGDPSAYLERYARESMTTRMERSMVHDLEYGEAAIEKLDFFPAGPGTPLAIFFHGGYWRRMDKSDFSFLAQGLIPLGISFASVNYGLAPQTKLPEIVAQARRAVKWCRNNHDRLEIDPARISVFGHSAGGHLAAMAAIDVPVHSVATISGLHDLQPVRNSFANAWLNLDERSAAQLSPISHAPIRRFRLYATAGEKESDAFKAQGRSIVDAWSKFGVKTEYEESEGDDHFTICFRMLNPKDRLTQKIAAIVRE